MSPRTILSIVGARPQFIKAAPVSKALANIGLTERLIHTGQHYDPAMSQRFFNELELRAPDTNLCVGSGRHGEQTARMLELLEQDMLESKPDCVLIYGDTNSTLAAALAASKLHIPVAHVEAGLRSFNRQMPEEINRLMADHVSTILFCPSAAAVENLRSEGIVEGVHMVGDTMLDAVLAFRKKSHNSRILEHLNLVPGQYIVATLHRPSNVDNPQILHGLLKALNSCGHPVIFPVHPRTKIKIEALDDTSWNSPPLSLIEPVGYLDMIRLLSQARFLVTDSGGLQKEAYFLSIPCITARTETEWNETVVAGWNTLTGPDPERLLRAIESFTPNDSQPEIYGNGESAERIARILINL